MPASLTAAGRKALQAQNRAIMELFEARGFEHIRPRILQPADVFLEKSGEDIRARTFLFTDPDGQRELCLRPDLTVPACRYHLAAAEDAAAEAKYCYRGPAFRFHGGSDPLFSDEFEQAGVEWFGAADAPRADAEILGLTLEALKISGLAAPNVMTGDVALIRALLASMNMPERWRRRLLMRFRRPADFHATLRRMASRDDGPRTSLSGLVDKLAGFSGQTGLEEAIALVEAELARRELPLVGGRDAEAIARRLLEKAQDRKTPPLPPAAVQLVEDFLAISGPAKGCAGQLMDIAKRAGKPMKLAVEGYLRRLEHLPDGGRVAFDAGFGRAFDYYTGFVFQIEAASGGKTLAVAGGGRYDGMLAGLGGPDTPACGLGIHTERLLMAAGGAA